MSLEKNASHVWIDHFTGSVQLGHDPKSSFARFWGLYFISNHMLVLNEKLGLQYRRHRFWVPFNEFCIIERHIVFLNTRLPFPGRPVTSFFHLKNGKWVFLGEFSTFFIVKHECVVINTRYCRLVIFFLIFFLISFKQWTWICCLLSHRISSEIVYFEEVYIRIGGI